MILPFQREIDSPEFDWSLPEAKPSIETGEIWSKRLLEGWKDAFYFFILG